MSVERRVTGGRVRWLARWRQDGRPRAKTFDRKTDADAFERERRREAALGAYGAPDPSPMRLDAWLEEWFDSPSHKWKPNTLMSYASVIDRWIVPYAGGVRLRDLGYQRVRRWQDEILKAGCSHHQANKARRVLSSALSAARREGLIPDNPVRGLRTTPTEPRRAIVLTPVEVEKIRRAMPTDRDVAFWSLVVLAGLRPGEARALRWMDVGETLLTIDRAVSGNVIGPTKTYKRRTVEIIAPLARDLDAIRPAGLDPDALVIADETGGVIDLDNWRRRVWKPAVARAGVDMIFRYGRHTYASLLIHEGRSLPSVTAALGHESSTTTLRHYAHVFAAARLATAVKMVPAIEAARAECGP
jgi:integrase